MQVDLSVHRIKTVSVTKTTYTPNSSHGYFSTIKILVEDSNGGETQIVLFSDDVDFQLPETVTK